MLSIAVHRQYSQSHTEETFHDESMSFLDARSNVSDEELALEANQPDSFCKSQIYFQVPNSEMAGSPILDATIIENLSDNYAELSTSSAVDCAPLLE